MEFPKPGPFKPSQKTESPAKPVKKNFTPKPHLTDRPFQNNEQLQALLKEKK